jgi:hypothetical protein
VLLRAWLARLTRFASFPRFTCLTRFVIFPRFACLARLTGFAGFLLSRFERGTLGLE